MVMYDNNMIMSLKQKKRKFEPRIKLNHNIYIYNSMWSTNKVVVVVVVVAGIKNTIENFILKSSYVT